MLRLSPPAPEAHQPLAEKADPPQAEKHERHPIHPFTLLRQLARKKDEFATFCGEKEGRICLWRRQAQGERICLRLNMFAIVGWNRDSQSHLFYDILRIMEGKSMLIRKKPMRAKEAVSDQDFFALLDRFARRSKALGLTEADVIHEVKAYRKEKLSHRKTM